MNVTKKCFCGKRTKVSVDVNKYNLWQAGAKIQNAMPELGVFDREVLISGTCYECQEKMFHRPAPGHEATWGKYLGDCTCCCGNIYELKDRKKDGSYFCSSCGNSMTLAEGVLHDAAEEY